MSDLLRSLIQTAIVNDHTSPEMKQKALDSAQSMMGRHLPDISLLHLITLDALAQVNFDRHVDEEAGAPEFKPTDVVDELLHRFCLRTMGDDHTLKAIAEVEQAEAVLSKLVGRVTSRLTGMAGREDAWVFLGEGQRLILRLEGFRRMKDAIRSSTSKTRNLFYPEPSKPERSLMHDYLQKNLGDRYEQQRQLSSLSDAILAEKTLAMICQSEMQKYTLDYPVYGVKTLMMYLPAVIDRLIGEPSEGLSLEYCQTHLNAIKTTSLKLKVIEASLQRGTERLTSEPAIS